MSDESPARSKPNFLKEHVLPLFFIFLIPAFSFWFFGEAEKSFDDLIRSEVLASIRSDSRMSDQEKDQALDAYQHLQVSEIMASNSPGAAEIQATPTRYSAIPPCMNPWPFPGGMP